MNWLTRTARKIRTSAPDAAPPTQQRPDGEVPCVPCAQKRAARQFAITASPVVVSETDVPHVSDAITFTVIDGSVVLYDMSAGVSHVLNPTAALIWSTIGDGLTVGQIIDEVAGLVGVDRPTIRADVLLALGQFATNGIASMTGPTEPSGPPPPHRWDRVNERILDEVPWVAELGPVRVGAAQVTIRTNNEDIAQRLAPMVAPLRPADAPDATPAHASLLSVYDSGHDGNRRFRIFVDGARQSAWAHADPIAGLVGTELNRLATEASDGRLMLHAGAVERDGHVVVIAGDSGRGKSTLTARLVQRGYAYVTDEVVALDVATGDVLPFPKMVSLDTAAQDLLGLDGASEPTAGKADIAPDEIGSVSRGGRAVLIVMLMGDADPASADPVMSPRVSTLIDLLGCTFLTTFDDADALEGLTQVVETLPVLRLDRLELDAMCDRIESELAAHLASSAV